MLFFERLRNVLFWATDALRGKKINIHITDILDIQNNYELGITKTKINQRLKDILEHSVKTTEFYKFFDSTSIQNFPVINKILIRENFNQFISNEFVLSALIPAITSGSTGTPFKILQDKNKKSRNTADTIYFAEQAGYRVGNKLYYFKIWSANNKKSKLKQIVENVVPVDVLNLNKNISKVLSDLKNNSNGISLLGYVSAFETLTKSVEDKKKFMRNIKVRSIITMSESLDDLTKKCIEEYFNCPVLSRYSNIENGILAQQTLSNQNQFTINSASYLIEIFDLESDAILPYGSLGRIVVTDFYNYGMPMIRYDTGDMGVLDEININGKKQLVLSKIEGRKLDRIFNTSGELLSSYIIYKNMWQYTEIEQYQFIQKSENDYVFKICIKNKFSKEKQLISEFKNYLGTDANFVIEYVNEIPLLNSGKRKKVVNLMQD